MDPIQMIKTLLDSNSLSAQKNIDFRPGQIILGKITTLFPNQIAEVQVGSQKMIAQLEVPLSVNDRYWFQVQPGEGKVHLKIIAQDRGNDTERKPPFQQLMAQFGLPATKENTRLLESTVFNGLPISKEALQQGAAWLKGLSEVTPGLETIKFMLDKGLPFTNAVFSALLSTRNPESIHSMMEHLFTSLQSDPSPNALSQSLQDVLKNLLSDTNVKGTLQEQLPIDWENGKMVSDQIKNLVKTIGLNYENEVTQAAVEHTKLEHELSLKPLLIRYLSEQPGSEQRNLSEQLLNRVTGLQLLSNDNGVMQQLVAQIPISFPDSQSALDATFQWTGRKREDGSIDPNYCRILFYLNLETLGDTVVDVQIQNRVMTAAVVNERDDLKALTQQLVKPLKERLRMLDYQLTSLTFSQPSEQQSIHDRIKTPPGATFKNDYQGVDFRI